ncbi:MAG: cadherin-like domain-containing protein, partial [Bifidobacteriaceae bacterium]|nr:cadherin-like domain-containing protein [Bifidobacteriaceae bacterium]
MPVRLAGGPRARRWVSAAAVAAVAVGWAGLAMVQRGFAVTELDLNDSGVWVTRAADALLGRFNYNAGVIDGSLYASSNAFDVLQDGPVVLALEPAKGQFSVVNTAQLAGGGAVAVAPGAAVELGGGSFAVFDAAEGELWVSPADQAAGFSAESPPTLSDLGEAALVAIGLDGATHVLDPAAEALWRVPPGGGEPARTGLEGLSKDGPWALTAVGGPPVVWDGASGQLFLGASPLAEVEGGAAQATSGETAGAGLALQWPGAAAAEVVYATADELVRQPLDGGPATTVAAELPGGQPARAVALGGCAYQVWSGTASLARDCAGHDDDLSTLVAEADPADELRFRVNWGRVVLNQLSTGGVWLVTDDLLRVDDWAAAAPQDQGEDESESKEESPEEAELDRPKENHPPVAQDDSFGVRAGRGTLLQVLANDSDEDGDLLTVSAQPDGFDLGTVSPVYGQTVFLVDVPGDASGSAEFEYTVSDGRGGQAVATATVEVHPPEVNEPPVAVREPAKVPVALGGEAAYQVLGDWLDPDGDDVFVVGAVADSEQDAARYQPDGLVRFVDGGVATGLKPVSIAVTDGSQAAAGEVVFDVRPSGNLPPRTEADHVQGVVGRAVEVQPLLNDSDPNSDSLRLVKASQPAGARVSFDSARGTVSLEAEAAGTVYLSYTVTDGP